METPYIPDKWKKLKLETHIKPMKNKQDNIKRKDNMKRENKKNNNHNHGSILKNKKDVYNEKHHKEYNFCETNKKNNCVIL